MELPADQHVARRARTYEHRLVRKGTARVILSHHRGTHERELVVAEAIEEGLPNDLARSRLGLHRQQAPLGTVRCRGAKLVFLTAPIVLVAPEDGTSVFDGAAERIGFRIDGRNFDAIDELVDDGLAGADG